MIALNQANPDGSLHNLSNTQAASQTAEQGAQEQTPPEVPERYFSLGDTLYARLSFTASNKGSPAVLAQITSGPYLGARLLGGIQSSDEGLIILFTKMSIPEKGLTLDINGLAIDLETARSTVFTKHRSYFWKRLFYSLGLGMVQGSAEAIAAVGETVVDTSFGGSTVVRDEPGVEDAVAAGVANAARTLGQQVQEQMSKLTDLYEFDTKTPLAIVMLTDVDVLPSQVVPVKKVNTTPASTKRFTY